MAYLARIKVVVGLAALVAVACGKDGGAEDPRGNGAPQGGEAGATATGGGGTATGGRSGSGGSGEGAEGGEATGAGGAPAGAPTAGGDAGGAGTGTMGGMLTGGAPTAGGDPGDGGGSTMGGMLTGGAPTTGGDASGAGTGTTGGSSTTGAVAGDPGGAGSEPTIPLCTLGQVTCDDGLACDGVEACDPVAAGADPVTGCAPGTPVVCPDEDGIACTVEYCSAATDSCTSVAQDAVCNDGAYCNGPETCTPAAEGADPATGCLPGEPVVCEEDEASCTTVTCDDDEGRCVAVPDDAACADTVFCNGEERCDPSAAGADAVTGCAPGEDPCPPDALACTNDGCDEFAGACVHLPDDDACLDDSTCNGSEYCHPELGCTAQDAVECPDDGFTCTVEECSEPDGTCATRVDPEVCGDVPCDPTHDDANPTTGCVLKPCTGDGDCLDTNVCNGVEECDTVAGFCRLSVPALDCDDGFDCTADSCDPVTGCRPSVPIHGICRDTNLCNGVEECDPDHAAADPTTGCVAGTAPDCDDGLDCTTDVCTFAVGCEHLPNHAACQDGQLCNGEERCDASAGCVAGSPYVCEGSAGCVTYTCDPVQNGCVAVPDNGACPCGETCDPERGCGNWCVVAACQGTVYQCGDCQDNDGDCLPDAADSACLGPCSNNEDGFKGEIPGQNESNTCVAECYFDGDTGGGNDGCAWDYTCDPLSVAPNYLPKGAKKCAYDAANVTCTEMMASQSTQCWAPGETPTKTVNVCGALTPNGCDCFGCCSVPSLSWNIWLGTQDDAKVGTCTPEVLADPTLTETQKRALCWPCTQVDSCLNECGFCEVCVGKPTIDPSCTPAQQCPRGEQACGVPGQDPCPSGYYCITGCCQPLPQ